MLAPDSFREIVDLLLPLMDSESTRRAKIDYAFGPDAPFRAALNFDGAANIFVPQLVTYLDTFGEIQSGTPALWRLLEVLRDQVRLDKKARIDALRVVFNLPPPALPDRVFISYSRRDEAFALRLVSDLYNAGLRVWFDRQKIKGGEVWWQSIQQGIENADFMVFCLSPNSVQSEVARRELQTARVSRKVIIPVMPTDCLSLLRAPEQAAIVWLADLHILNFTDASRYGTLFRELIGSLPGYNPPDSYYADTLDYTQIPNPFRGLEAFREIDYHYFAGREEAVTTLLERLEHGAARLLAVVGASGSGKSSLVRAGLIPALREAKGALAWWESTTMTPGHEPIKALADRLQLRLDLPAETLRTTLTNRVSALHDLADDIMTGKPEAARFVVVVDQFEEVFTQAPEADRSHFLALLHHAATAINGRTQIILTMRADFFDKLSAYPDFAPLVQDNLYIATDMSADALRRSIKLPAQKVGLQYDDGLADQILDEVREQPGSLPLLQYALKELYERRVGRALTRAAYEKMGGVQGALATRADTIYHALAPEQQAVMRRILLRLIDVAEDSITRRRVERGELRFRNISIEATNTILDRLTAPDARLLVATSPIGDKDTNNDAQVYVEVSHEALITRWETFTAWVNERRDDLRLDTDLRHLAADWDKDERKIEYVLTGRRLIAAQDWLRVADAPSPLQGAFIEASAANQSALIALEERRKQELIAAAQRAEQATQDSAKAAERATTSTQRLKSFRRVTIVVGIVAAAIVVYATLSVSKAQSSVTDANNTLTPIPQTITAAEKAVTVANGQVVNAQSTLANFQPTLTEVVQQVEDGQRQIALAQSKFFASVGLQKLATDPIASLGISLLGLKDLSDPRTYAPQAIFSLTQALQNTLELSYLKLPAAPNYAIAFSPKSLAVINEDTLLQYDNGLKSLPPLPVDLQLPPGTPGRPITQKINLPSTGMDWSADGRLLSYSRAKVQVWQQDRLIVEHSFPEISDARWRPDGGAMAVATTNTVMLWGANDQAPQPLFTFDGKDVIESLRWSSDSQNLAAWANTTVLLWDGQVLAQIDLKESVYDVVWMSDNKHILVAAGTSVYQLSLGDTTAPAQPLMKAAGLAHFRGFALSEDQQRLLIYEDSGRAQIINTTNYQLITLIQGHEASILDAAWFGDYLLTASVDKTARLWDTKKGTELAVLTGNTGRVIRVHWLPNGQAITLGQDNSLRLWQVLDNQGLPQCADREPDTQQPLCHNLGVALPNVSQAHWFDSTHLLLVMTDGSAQRIALDSAGRTIQREVMLPNKLGKDQVTLWDPSGTRLFLYRSNQKGQVWTISAETPDFETDAVIDSAFWLDADRLLVGNSKTKQAWLLDSKTGKVLVELAGNPTRLIAAELKGSQLAGAVSDGRIIIWNAQTGAAQTQITLPSKLAVNAIHWNAQGDALVSSSINGDISLYDPQTGSITWTYPQSANAIRSGLTASTPFFSPNGQYIAAAVSDGFISLDVASGKLIHANHAVQHPILGIQWNTESTELLAWGANGPAQLWQLDSIANTETEILRLPSGNGVNYASMSPDNVHIVTVDDRNTLVIWPSWPNLQQLIATATQYVTRPLSDTDTKAIAAGSLNFSQR